MAGATPTQPTTVRGAQIQPRRMLRWLNPIHTHFRRKRMQAFVEHFQPSATTTILDVGGTPQNWRLIVAQPQITLLNLPGRQPTAMPSNMQAQVGDGCAMEFADAAFDIVFSNSVVEHVGTWEDQQRFAREVQRVGQSYYVQTPNKWFPLEPHVITLGVHWLPHRWQRRVLPYTCLSAIVRRGTPWLDRYLGSVRLLTYAECRTLFPNADIQRERFLGLTKSFVIRESQATRTTSH